MKQDKDLTNIINSDSFSVTYNEPKEFQKLLDLHVKLSKLDYQNQEWRLSCLHLFINTCEPTFTFSGNIIENNLVPEYMDNMIEVREFVLFTNTIKTTLENFLSGAIMTNERVDSIKYMSTVIIDLKPFTRSDDEYSILVEKKTQNLNASALLVLNNKEAYQECISELVSGKITRKEYSDKILFYVEPYVELFVETIIIGETKSKENSNSFNTSKKTEEEIKNMVKSDSLTPSQNLTPKQQKIARQNAAKLKERVKSGAYKNFVRN